MQISAEIRWFWRAAPPEGLEAWFRNPKFHGYEAGGGNVRHDEYLRDSDLELAVKRRDGHRGGEIKGFLGTTEDGLPNGPFRGEIQLWGKWNSMSLELDNSPLVTIEKHRWLRMFSTLPTIPVEIPLNGDEQPLRSLQHHPTRFCTVELTRINVADEDTWWSFGFEAVGSLSTVEDDLRRATALFGERWTLPCLDGLQASYPAWLKEHAMEVIAAHATV